MSALAEAPPFQAGVYDIPEDIYHGDPVPGGSLSVSGAKKLLPPSCPALFDYERRSGRKPTRALELGTAAHKLVLGAGWPFAVIDAGDYRTKAAQQARDEARGAGKVPLLTHEHEQVQAMAAAIREHPLASALLCRGDVEPERSLFWHDEEFGIWRRSRLDAIRQRGRVIIADYKSAASADPGKFARAAYDFRYHMQEVWYRDAVAACYGADAEFLFVAQEKTAPYLVTVCRLDFDAQAAGAAANRKAMEIYRDCQQSGIWPGYQPDNDIALLSLPAWARTREDFR